MREFITSFKRHLICEKFLFPEKYNRSGGIEKTDRQKNETGHSVMIPTYEGT